MSTIYDQDSQDMKDLALMSRYAIRNQEGDFWSAASGWGSYSSADVYTEVEQPRTELPDGGEWVSLTESRAVGVPDGDLRVALGEGFEDRAGAMVDREGLLYEFSWSQGRRVDSLEITGEVLTARLVLPEAESRHAHRETCVKITEELAGKLKGLLPESAGRVKVLPRPPIYDEWNKLWNFELVLAEAEDDELDAKGVFFSGIPEEYSKPHGLSDEGERAWHVVVGLLGKWGALDAGGQGHIFYTPEQWREKGYSAFTEDGDALVVTYDGGAHAPYFTDSFRASVMRARMGAALRQAGFEAVEGSNWSTTVRVRDDRKVTDEAVGSWLEGRDQPIAEDETSDDMKDQNVPLETEARIRHLFTRAGLHVNGVIEAPEDPDWGTLGGPMRIIKTVLQPSNERPWSFNSLGSPELATFCQQIKSFLYEILDTPEIEYTTQWKEDLGALEITWFIGDQTIGTMPVKESEEDDDFKDVSLPNDYMQVLIDNTTAILTEMGFEDTCIKKLTTFNRLLEVVTHSPMASVDGQPVVNRSQEIADLLKTYLRADLVTKYATGDRSNPQRWRYRFLAYGVRHEDEPENAWESLGAGDAPIRPCLNCGYCCKQAPCSYGEPGEGTNACKHLTPDNKCGLYGQEQISQDPVSPAFGSGCCSPMNSDRMALARRRAVQIVPRGTIKEDEEQDDFKDVSLVGPAQLDRNVVADAFKRELRCEEVVVMRWTSKNMAFICKKRDWMLPDTLRVKGILRDLGLTPEQAAWTRVTPNGEEGFVVYVLLRFLAKNQRKGQMESEAGGTEEQDDFKDVAVPNYAKRQDSEVIAAELKRVMGCSGVRLGTRNSRYQSFICQHPYWTGIDTLKAKLALQNLGLNTEQEVRIAAIPMGPDAYVIEIPIRFVKPHEQVESTQAGVVQRIIEAQGTVLSVQDVGTDDFVSVNGEWNEGKTLSSVAEALDVDKESLNYDDKTGRFTLLVKSQTVLDEASMVEPAVLVKRTRQVVTGSTHSEAMENLLQQGYFKKVKSLADLEALGQESNDAYNAIWNQVEIGFLTRQGEFVTRDEASRITGIPDVHGEDLREHAEEDDDNKVSIVAVFREKEGGYECLVCKREVDPAKGAWAIAGGHAKEGESAEVAAKREMKEETHLDLEDLVFVKKMPNEDSSSTVYVYGTMLPEGDRAKAGDDAEKLKWVPLDDLPALAFDNQDLVREIAAKMGLAGEGVEEALCQECSAGQAQVQEGVEHLHQECEYDCGPTCIKMAANALGVGQEHSIQDLVKLCGTDPETGTDDRKMAAGMKAVGVPFQVGEAKDTDGLVQALERGSLIILRTLTRGIKHWVVVYGFEDGAFQVNDPWLGQIDYTPEEVLAIWKPRAYFYFEVPAGGSVAESEIPAQIVLSKVTDEVLPSLQEAILKVFEEQADWVVPYVVEHMDPDISVVAIDHTKAVIGFYILGNRTLAAGVEEEGLTPTEDLEPYAQKRGVEGVALGIVPEARGQGLGSRLKDYPQTLGADYIWGLQLYELNNVQHWLKRRRIVAKNEEMVATLQDLKSSPR